MTTETTQTATVDSRIPRMMTTKQLAEVIKVNVGTLQNWRHSKIGPPSFRLEGSVRYSVDEVVAWIEQQRQAEGEAE